MNEKKSELNLSTVNNSQEMGQAIVELFVNNARKAINENGRFCVAISRKLPGTFIELLCRKPEYKSLQWDKIHLFCIDHFCGLSGSKQECCFPANPACISGIGIPPENLHCICAKCRGCESAASTYERTIRTIVRHDANHVPQFDLVLLSMESDGHIASLFPDTYAFFELEKLVCVTYFTDSRHTRITMTHPLLYSASVIVVSVEGRENAIFLKGLFTNEHNVARYPIHSLWPVMDKVVWLADHDAVELLLPSCRIEMNCRNSAFRQQHAERSHKK
jgi:6-phosphogluconolactonase